MQHYVVKENDLTMNPITGKPLIGKDDQKYFTDTQRSKLNQIERGNQKFYNKLKEYITSEKAANKAYLNNKVLPNVSFDSRQSHHQRSGTFSMQNNYVAPGKFSTQKGYFIFISHIIILLIKL